MKGFSYTDAEFERIDAAIGPCLPGRDRADMLEHIDWAAMDYVNMRSDNVSMADVRNQLRELAEALAQAGRRMDALDLPSELYFILAAQNAGLPKRLVGQKPEVGYLEQLLKVALAAAEMPPVKSASRKNEPLAHFIRALARIVELWTGQKARGPAYRDYDETYNGWFLDLVKACLEPLPTDDSHKSDAALAKAVQRALGAKDKPRPIRPLVCPLYGAHSL